MANETPFVHSAGLRYSKPETHPDRMVLEYVDTKIDLAKREIMTELDKRIGDIETQLGGLPSTSTIWKATGTAVGGMVTAVGLLFGILSWTGDRVDGAVSASESFNDQIVASKVADAEQEQSIDQVNQKLDLLIAARSGD